MRKFSILALLTLLIFGSQTTPTLAFVKPVPNGECSNLGYFGIADGKMMTCVQSGSKMLWKLESNVIAGGHCSWWVPGDTSTWAELQLFLNGSWKTQLYPIAFTPGPSCDRANKSRSSIPWIALPNKIAEGTKFRWLKGKSGSDGHGGRAFAEAYADPTVVYSSKAMKSPSLKLYTAIVAPIEGPHVYAISHKAGATTSTQAGFKAPNPISLPVPQNGSITFSNVLDHISEIPQVAWQRVQDIISSNTPSDVPTDIFLGPTTRLDVAGGVSAFQAILHRDQRLWSGFSQSPYYSVYIYNAHDEPWAENKLTTVFKSKGYESGATAGPLNSMRNACKPAVVNGKTMSANTNCQGGNSGAVLNSNDSHMEFAQPNVYQKDYSEIVAHEYIHAVQAAQWINSPYCKNASGGGCFRSDMANRLFSSCWIYEGQPVVIGFMVAKTEYQSYLDLRQNWAPSITGLPDFTAATIRKYLFESQAGASCKGPEIGAAAVEALIAIGGPQATMSIFALGAEGQNFETAFQNIYGISWSDASTILSRVIAAEYINFTPH